jgi:hypothetical protein
MSKTPHVGAAVCRASLCCGASLGLWLWTWLRAVVGGGQRPFFIAPRVASGRCCKKMGGGAHGCALEAT